MKNFKAVEILCLAGLLAGVAGCPKAPVKPEPTPTPVAMEKPQVETATYVVQPGDSLWAIATENNVMGDSFRWPLLYKANRDQIQDPNLIEPKQELQFKKQYDESEVSDAVKKAKETPPYSPRSSVKKKVKY